MAVENMDFVAVDLETTGLSAEKCYILEIGAIKIIDGEAADTYETFVRCPVAIDPRITELTGITDEMVSGGKDERQAVKELLAFAEGYVLLGHNIPFDYGFIKAAARRQGIEYEAQGLDTLKIARQVLPDLEKRSLEYLCGYYHIETAQSHRALEDAKAAAELYKILYKKFGGQERLFAPMPLQARLNKIEPITAPQKKYLQALLCYHGLTLPVPIDKLSKSEASRRIDTIIREFGRIPAGR